MKKVIVAASVLMMTAGTVFAVQYTLTSNGHSSIVPVPGATFQLELSLDPQGTGLVSWQVAFSAPDGYEVPTNPGTAGFAPGNAIGWDGPDGVLPSSGAYPKPLNDYKPIGTTYDENMIDPSVGVLQAGIVFVFNVKVPQDAPLGQISLSSARYG
ncbi:MAG: hypothetical protein ACUVXJ_19150, partial [Phycisphaerae bacterium]